LRIVSPFRVVVRCLAASKRVGWGGGHIGGRGDLPEVIGQGAMLEGTPLDFVGPLQHLNDLTGAAVRIFRPQDDHPIQDGLRDPTPRPVGPVPGVQRFEAARPVGRHPA
jgi:hypothetical protein